ncbi:MAG: DNA polymerase I, partial [Thermodesulfobacteriota bacterium]
MIFRFLRDYEPEYLGIVFDSEGETFRNDIYPLYKANRDEPPEELKLQFPKIFEVVDALALPMFQKEGYEADDIIGTIANSSEILGINLVVITGDKDFYQLVSDRVSLIDTMRNRKTGVKDVIDKLGVPPDKVTDIFALSGDSIDNIPGVRGIGEKTARELIGKFGSLKGLFENVDKISKRQKNLIEENKENALLSEKLVTIKTDVPIKFKLDDFRYEGFDKEKLVRIFEELEFKSLISELGNNSSVELENTFGDVSKRKVSYDKYQLVLPEADLDRLIKRINKSGEVSIDLETTSNQPMRAMIVGISLCPFPHEAYYIPIAHKASIESPKQLNIDYVFEKIKAIIEDGKIKKIGQNVKYEYIVFERNGIRLKGIFFDTMIAAHLLYSSNRSYSLDELAKTYLGHKTITYKDLTGTGKSKIDFEEVDLEKAKVYACEDADVAMILSKKLMLKLKELNLVQVFNDVHLKLIEVIAGMEMSGVKVDSSRLKELSIEFEDSLEELAEEIYSIVGYKFNLNSPIQLREVLFVNLKLPKKKLTRKGEPSTDVEVLSDLRKFHPVPEKILEFRGLSKLKSTYVDALPKLINAETGRIHTSFNQVGTSTGRVSSSDPNLQNIPIKTEEGKRIREAFIPEKGLLLLSADYSQIELRLLAHFSGDESLRKA